jgi:3-hydroxybutyryl-CoA dehydratase
MSQASFPGGDFAKEDSGRTITFEDFHVGERIITPSRTITEADIKLFTDMTGYCATAALDLDIKDVMPGLSATRVAQGFLTLALSSGLMFRAGNRGVPRSTIALWGIEKACFLAPAKVGDTIYVESTVAQLATIDTRRGLIAYEHRVVNQRGEEILTYVSKLIVARRLSEAEAISS